MMIKNSNLKKITVWIFLACFVGSEQRRGPRTDPLTAAAACTGAVRGAEASISPSSLLLPPLSSPHPPLQSWVVSSWILPPSCTHTRTHTHSGNLWATSRLLGEEEEKKKSLEKQKSVGSNRVKLSGHGEAVRVKLLRVPV